jgi:DNA-directed RNA polymerase specialized sigma24 family protein
VSCKDFRQYNDGELLAEILRKECPEKDREAAWNEFASRFRPILFKAIISSCRRCVPQLTVTREDVEDMAQHIYFKLFRNDCRVLREFVIYDEDSLKCFLYDAARNVVIDRIRYLAAARRALITYSLSEPVKYQNYFYSSPEELYLQKERLYITQKVLNEEKDERKREYNQRILRDYFEGYNLNEIVARNNGLKRTAINDRINWMRLKIQEIFRHLK